MKHLITIIIPTYNRGSLIGECLESILAQSYSEWECLVIDDRSTDHTQELMEFYCKKDHRIKFFLRPGNRKKGANSCRNFGFEKSNGEFIQWIDSDDLIHSKKLEVQLNSLLNSVVDFSVCRMSVLKDNKVETEKHGEVVSERAFEDYLRGEISFTTSNPLWRKKSLLRLPYLFDEELQAGQEFEFHCRVLGLSYTYVVVNEVLFYFRKHNDSISYNDRYLTREWNYFLARYKLYSNESLTLTPEIEEYLLNYFITFYKDSVQKRSLKAGFLSFNTFILWEKRISFFNKVKGLLALLSFGFTGKGYFILKGLKFQ